MKKISLILSSAILGACVFPVTVGDDESNSEGNNLTANSKISLPTILPNNTNIGEVTLLKTASLPTEIQVLGLINIWMHGKPEENQWFINQVEVVEITTTSAKIRAKNWSPNYDTNFTIINFSIKKVDKISLRQAITEIPTGTGTINLNLYKGESLSKMTTDDIKPLTGAAKTTALLKWLNSSVMYSSILYINQINVPNPLLYNSATNKYTFSISAKNNSNVYTTGEISIEFTISKIDISTIAGLQKKLSFTKNPTELEVASQFLNINNTLINNEVVSPLDITVNSFKGDEGCSIEVLTNEYYYTSTPIALTWTTTKTVDIATVITVTQLGAIDKIKDLNDFIFLVEDVNPGVTIQWDNLDVVIGESSATITAKAGSIFYTGTVNVIFTINRTTATVKITNVEAVSGSTFEIGDVILSNYSSGTITAQMIVGGAENSDYVLSVIGVTLDRKLVLTQRNTNDTALIGKIAIYNDGEKIGESEQVTFKFLMAELNLFSTIVTDTMVLSGNEVEFNVNCVGKTASIDVYTESGAISADITATFDGTSVVEQVGRKAFTIHYPQWDPKSYRVTFKLSLTGFPNISTQTKTISIDPLDQHFYGYTDIQPLIIDRNIETKKELTNGILTNFYQDKFKYDLVLFNVENQKPLGTTEYVPNLVIDESKYDPVNHTVPYSIEIESLVQQTNPYSCELYLYRDGTPMLSNEKLTGIYLLTQKSKAEWVDQSITPDGTSKNILNISNLAIDWNYTNECVIEVTNNDGTSVSDKDAEFFLNISPTLNQIRTINVYARYHTKLTGTYTMVIYTRSTNAPTIFPNSVTFTLYEINDLIFVNK